MDQKTLYKVIAVLIEEQKLNKDDPVIVSLLQRLINRFREMMSQSIDNETKVEK